MSIKKRSVYQKHPRTIKLLDTMHKLERTELIDIKWQIKIFLDMLIDEKWKFQDVNTIVR